MPAHPDPTAKFLADLRAYLSAAHPGFPLDCLKFVGRNGCTIKFRPPAGYESAEQPIEPPRDALLLNPMEETILEALGDSTMTAEQISVAAGYPNEPIFRACLAGMRRRRLLTGAKGETGYAVATPSGFEPSQAASSTPAARHSPDFRTAHWFGADYAFSTTQAAVVRRLWDAWECGIPGVGQALLLEEAESDGDRLRDLFRTHPAWQTMICATGRGVFGLRVALGETRPRHG